MTFIHSLIEFASSSIQHLYFIVQYRKNSQVRRQRIKILQKFFDTHCIFPPLCIYHRNYYDDTIHSIVTKSWIRVLNWYPILMKNNTECHIKRKESTITNLVFSIFKFGIQGLPSCIISSIERYNWC